MRARIRADATALGDRNMSSELAILDCVQLTTENGHAALLWLARVTRGYQSDSSSKRPAQSVPFASPSHRGGDLSVGAWA